MCLQTTRNVPITCVCQVLNHPLLKASKELRAIGLGVVYRDSWFTIGPLYHFKELPTILQRIEDERLTRIRRLEIVIALTSWPIGRPLSTKVCTKILTYFRNHCTQFNHQIQILLNVRNVITPMAEGDLRLVFKVFAFQELAAALGVTGISITLSTTNYFLLRQVNHVEDEDWSRYERSMKSAHRDARSQASWGMDYEPWLISFTNDLVVSGLGS